MNNELKDNKNDIDNNCSNDEMSNIDSKESHNSDNENLDNIEDDDEIMKLKILIYLKDYKWIKIILNIKK